MRTLPMGITPVRSIRIPADVAEAVRKDARRLGITFSEIVVKALRHWLTIPARERI